VLPTIRSARSADPMHVESLLGPLDDDYRRSTPEVIGNEYTASEAAIARDVCLIPHYLALLEWKGGCQLCKKCWRVQQARRSLSGTVIS
jgi:hypothetical protein